MKRTSQARFVAVGRESPAYVDKHRTNGVTFTKADLVAAQLRGEPARLGEAYGKALGEPIDCGCGGSYQQNAGHRRVHEGTRKHREWVDSQPHIEYRST